MQELAPGATRDELAVRHSVTAPGLAPLATNDMATNVNALTHSPFDAPAPHPSPHCPAALWLILQPRPSVLCTARRHVWQRGTLLAHCTAKLSYALLCYGVALREAVVGHVKCLGGPPAGIELRASSFVIASHPISSHLILYHTISYRKHQSYHIAHETKHDKYTEITSFYLSI